ncbi:protein-disulfide isomerase [Oxalobacteraceae bacterium GrIS 2.11]
MSTATHANEQVKQELTQQLESDHCIGAPDARLVLLEYGDYECPSCADAFPLTKHLVESFGDQIKFIFRHYPLTEIHPHAELAAEAAEAAGAQGRFWEMHDLLFTNSTHLKMPALISYAEQLELDMVRFQAEMQDRIYLQRVQDHRHSAELLELRSTPVFFLNHQFIDVSFNLEHLEKAVFEAVNRSKNQGGNHD